MKQDIRLLEQTSETKLFPIGVQAYSSHAGATLESRGARCRHEADPETTYKHLINNIYLSCPVSTPRNALKNQYAKCMQRVGVSSPIGDVCIAPPIVLDLRVIKVQIEFIPNIES